MTTKIYVKSFKALVIGKKYLASGITSDPILIFRGKTDNGHMFETYGDQSKGTLFAKSTSVLSSWDLIELTEEEED